MELNIKTFIKDSRRPAWLLRLLSAVKCWCPFTNIKREDAGSVISLIESEIRNTYVVCRSKRYSLADRVRCEITDNKLTIYTLYKDNPVVEFSIE